jgi:hypothetical protein
VLGRWPVGLLASGVVALLGAACSPHEFKDPTSATTELLYVKPVLPTATNPLSAAPAGPSSKPPSAGATKGDSEPPQQMAPAPEKDRAGADESTRPVRSDVLELVTGHRVEGTITQLTPTVVVIETGGQAITFERAKVKSIQLAPRPQP